MQQETEQKPPDDLDEVVARWAELVNPPGCFPDYWPVSRSWDAAGGLIEALAQRGAWWCIAQKSEGRVWAKITADLTKMSGYEGYGSTGPMALALACYELAKAEEWKA